MPSTGCPLPVELNESCRTFMGPWDFVVTIGISRLLRAPNELCDKFDFMRCLLLLGISRLLRAPNELCDKLDFVRCLLLLPWFISFKSCSSFSEPSLYELSKWIDDSGSPRLVFGLTGNALND